MTASTSTPLEHAEEGRRFLQLRTARFGLYGKLLGFFFVIVRVVDSLGLGHPHALGHPSMLHHVLAALSLLSIWILCRRGVRSVRFVRAVEATGLLLACVFYAGMGSHLPLIAMPPSIVTMALGFGLVARAVYVPSSARRTLVLTYLSAVPVLVTTYAMYANMTVGRWTDVAPNIRGMNAAEVARSMTFLTAAWWLCIVLICSGASRVIYGLRKEVRDVRRLGQYTLVEKLGEGGMGTVYRATHAMLRRPTAIKLLPVEKSGAEQLARFEKEVQLTALLTHPNTVTIYDYGRTPEGVFYYAMELLDGATLTDVVKLDGPQPPARVARILGQVAGALAEAHAANLVQPDVKPANVMLVEQGGQPDVAKVLDFGLVKELERTDDVKLTLAGAVTGTPQYLSPEAIQRPDVPDPRSDLYALGAVGYYLLTGTQVFEAETLIELCMAHMQREPEPPSVRLDRPVPADLETVLLACLAKDPARRPESALRLQADLLACRDLGPWTEAEARAWWTRMRPVLAAHRPAPAIPGSDRTLDVAPRGRKGR